MLEYHAAYFLGEDNWVVADVLDFPGVLSQGRTLNSARAMIRDALSLMVRTLLEEGKPLPRSDPKARDKTAIFSEKIPVLIKVPKGKPLAAQKIPRASA